MRTFLLVLFSTLFLAYASAAQRGEAPPGYYPMNYHGDTFTGTVISTDAATDTITLEYKKGKKSETLPVNLNGGCDVPSKTGASMHAVNIPAGTRLTAFYIEKTDKSSGQKKTVNDAIGLTFIEWNGKTVNNTHMFSCGIKPKKP